MKVCFLFCVIIASCFALQCEIETGICSDIVGKEIGHNGILMEKLHKPSKNTQEVSEFVKNLVANLSLREKIGQMTQLDVSTLLNQTALANGILSLNRTALHYGVKNFGVGSYLNSPFSGGPVGGLSVSSFCDFRVQY